MLAEDAYLPAADTTADPGVVHAEGLAYFAETGFPVTDQPDAIAGSATPLASSTSTQPYVPTASHEFEEYFDSAPIPGLNEAIEISKEKTSSALPASGLTSASDKKA